MVRSLKRILSLALALVMVLGMIPESALRVLAAEGYDHHPDDDTKTAIVEGGGEPAGKKIPDGTHWEGPVKSADVICGKIEHSHNDDCYDKVLNNCNHGENHTTECYTDEENCLGYSGWNKKCTEHTYHWTENYIKGYDANTLSCSHVHTPYGQTNSCYAKGDLGEGCPTRSWRNGNVLEGDFGGWEFYEHTHTEPACYSYTWTLVWNVYNVVVSFEGNEVGVTASEVPATATHGTDVTFKLSATNDPTRNWTATINGGNPTPLSADEDTVVVASGITSGGIVVALTSEELPTYTVKVDNELNKTDGCSYHLDKTENLLKGNTVDLTVTVPDNSASASYEPKVTVSGEGASYADGVIIVGTGHVTVTIDYGAKKLSGLDYAEVPFNGAYAGKVDEMSEDELNALKQAIFDELKVVSLPEGATWDNVTIEYLSHIDIDWLNSLSETVAERVTELLESTNAWMPLDEGNPIIGKILSYEVAGYKFGAHTTETVRITYNGLSIEAEIYLSESRKATVTFVDADGTVLQSGEVTYGTVPVYSGATPTKEADVDDEGNVIATYVFSWDQEITAVTGDVTYTATYEKVVAAYTITWVNGDGTTYSYDVPYGTTPGELAAMAPEPSKTSDAQYHYHGTWGTLATVTGDAAYTAVFEKKLRSYTITWVNGDETTTTQNFYGETPVAPAATKSDKKDEAGNVMATYTDGVWGEIATVSGDASYTAAFTEVPAQYTVTWTANGVEFDTQTGVYGTAVTLPAAVPEAFEDANGTMWSFDRWDAPDDLGTLVGNVTYTAVYKLSGNDAKVVHADGTETYYKDLKTALSQAADGETVVLLADVTLAEKLTVSGNITIHGGAYTSRDTAYTIFRGDDYTGTLFAVSAGATLTLDGGLTIDGGNNYAFDKDAFMADANSHTQVSKDDSAKWFTPEEGAPVATAFMFTTTGGTINLNDVTIQNNYSTNSGVISAGANSTINLNGAKINHVASTQGNGVVANVSGANIVVTVNEGTVIDGNHVGGNHGLFKIYSGAKLVMNGGEITNNTGWNSNGVVVGMYYGTMELKGGTICSNAGVYGPSNGRNAAIYGHNTHTFIMTGGTICHNTGAYGGVDAPYSNGTTVISGGSIVNNVSSTNNPYYDINAADQLKISGGTFTQDVNRWCVDGFKAMEIEPGVWGIQIAYLVTFVDENGNVLQEATKFAENEMPVYTGAAIGEREFYDWSWNPELVPATEDATYVLTWVPRNDQNGNGVADELETVNVIVVGNGTVNGNAADFTMVYDSTAAPAVAINAVPVLEDGVSKTYVSSVTANGVEQALTYTDYCVVMEVPAEGEIVVTFADAKFVYNDERLMNYYAGMKNVAQKDLYDIIANAPAYDDADEVTITYKAREAMTHKVALDVLKNGNFLVDAAIDLLKSANIEGVVEDGYILISMDALWLPVDVENKDPFPESVPLEVAVDNFLETHDFGDLISSLWGKITAGKLDEVGTAISDFFAPVYESAQYFDAHRFGDNLTGGETVTEQIKLTYRNEALYIEGETSVDLRDTRKVTTIAGNNIAVAYRDYTDEELFALVAPTVTDEDGNVVAGAAVTCASIIDPYTFEGKAVSDNAYELTFKFAGNDEYRPSEGVFTVTVTKADLSMDLPNVITTYGEEYNAMPEYTMGNAHGIRSEIDESLIKFVIGLDLAEFDVDQDGVTGLKGKMQLIMSKDLQELLDTALSLAGKDPIEGVEMSLSELMEYLSILEDSSVDMIKQALETISGIVETGDLVITLGGAYPTNVGAYLYGAVTTNPNYETAFDVGYIVIKPAATRVYLDWNYSATNGVFTPALLQDANLSASAYAEADFVNEVAGATALVNNLFFGIDANGEFVALLFNKDVTDPEELEKALTNGAYAQMAFVAEFGNEFYYSVPIVRAFVIVPDVLDVKLVGQNGTENRELLKTFNNQPQGFSVKITNADGGLVYSDHYQSVVNNLGENAVVTYNYVGIQTNGTIYNSTEKPVHAGAYAVTVSAEVRDADGNILAFGADAGVLVIEPTTSVAVVEDKIVVNQQVKFADMVSAGSTVPGMIPDTTIITAGIDTNEEINESGLEAVNGIVNVDFPAWIDALIAEYAPSIVQGITAADFAEKLVSKLPSISAKLEELGATNEMLNSLENAVTNVAKVLDKLPDNVQLSFKDNAAANDIGAYIIIAVVTDSDHYPAVDAGYLVVLPDVAQVNLKWNYEDANGIFTRDLLALENIDLLAKAYDAASGELNAEATEKITYQFIGIDSDNEFKVYTNPADLPNGAYLELAYIEFFVDGEMAVSDMIARPVMVVASSCTVTIENVETVFDNMGHGAGITVTDLEGRVIDTAKGELNVLYAGLQTNGLSYLSGEAPAHAGVYEVLVTYTEKDVNGELRYYGANAGYVMIDLAQSAIDVADSTVTYDGNGHTITVKTTGGNVNPDYTLISGGVYTTGKSGLETFHGNVNIDLPGWLDAALAEYEFTNGINAAKLADYIGAYRDEIAAQIPADYAGKVNGYIDELLQVLTQLPQDVTLTFETGKTYTEPGTYLYYGIVTDSDHYPSADTGLLVIEKAEITSVEVISDHVYDGTEQTATLIVKAGDLVLTADDYTVTGNTGTDAGSYTVSVVGTGNFKGTASAQWKIMPTEITAVCVSGEYFYNDEEQTAVVVVKWNDSVLAEGVDYEIVSGNTAMDAGDYTVEVKGIGNFTGTLAANWTIEKAVLVVSVDDKVIKLHEQIPELTFTVDTAACQGFAAADKLTVTMSTEPAQNSVGQYIPGEYVINGTAVNTDNWTILLANGTLTVEMGDYICWNTQTGEYFDDVSAALDKANMESGAETIQMLRDATVENGKNELILIVYTGTAFDLNGHYVQTANLLSYGVVMDRMGDGTADEAIAGDAESQFDDNGITTGGILIDIDTTKAWTQLQAENGGYLPIYDTVTGSYKFYTGEMSGYDVVVHSTDSIRFRYRLLLDNAEGYSVILNTADTGFKIVLNMTWPGVEAYGVTYSPSKDLITQHITNQVTTGNRNVMYIRLYGLDKLDSGIVSAQPVLTSKTGVINTAEKLEHTK